MMSFKTIYDFTNTYFRYLNLLIDNYFVYWEHKTAQFILILFSKFSPYHKHVKLIHLVECQKHAISFLWKKCGKKWSKNYLLWFLGKLYKKNDHVLIKKISVYDLSCQIHEETHFLTYIVWYLFQIVWI